ncbi:unnamed protein product [Amoebophrya sp. A120]|nr:unnamed protein product [Amoebophrya sp. A120]|eukprot:GSA120T00013088001.1
MNVVKEESNLLYGGLLRKDVARMPVHQQRYLYTSFILVQFLLTQVLGVYAIFHLPRLLHFFLFVDAILFLFLWKNRFKNVYFVPTLICTTFGLALGGLAAAYNWRMFFEHVVFYDTGTTYRNVVPTSPAEAFLDASQMQFSHESIVETTRGVGYKRKGTMYCIAPIVEKDAETSSKVSFWAVGMNCCDTVGHFYCDSSIEQSVHTASVILRRKPSRFWTKSGSEIFEDAQLKAEGQFSLPHEEHTLYVRWMKDTTELRDTYVAKSLVFFFVSAAVVAFLGFGFTFVLTKVFASVPSAMHNFPNGGLPGMNNSSALDKSYGSVGRDSPLKTRML